MTFELRSKVQGNATHAKNLGMVLEASNRRQKAPETGVVVAGTRAQGGKQGPGHLTSGGRGEEGGL